MSTLFFEKQLLPFDLLFRDFFNSKVDFQPAINSTMNYPVDIFETKNGLHFEIACTGLSKSDIDLKIEGDILKISYIKNAHDSAVENEEHQNEERSYIYKSISKRSFNLGYKIASKFDLSKVNATMENGLLSIHIPFAEEAKPKTITIK